MLTMRYSFWILLFIAALAAEILGVQLQNETMQLIAKPLLMPPLAMYFLGNTHADGTGLKPWVLLALFFSWLGDILLLFQEKQSIFFLLGLSAFLLAHVSYIIYFHKIRLREGIRSNPWYLLLVVIYYITLMLILSPFLGEMKLPVRIYGIVISFMFMLAMHVSSVRRQFSGYWMLTGAFLFVASDSILAFNKFYMPLPSAGFLIMITYGLAQLFIVEGAVRYARSVKSA